MSEPRKGYQLTEWLKPDDKFLNELVNKINNKNYKVAFVRTKKGKLYDKSAVFIEVEYWKKCCKDVQNKCKIKTMNN